MDGTITIDSLDTGFLGLHDLRSKISIIPQEPVLFSASMRYNLDPFDEYDDGDLWNALQEVDLLLCMHYIVLENLFPYC